ncbi:MAG: tetratricopeptide repeat protein [Bryobacteraceae bacterium]|jgi:TolA-binding protein
MFRRLCVWILIASPLPALAASKEYEELQRDIAQLQEMVKTLQQAQAQSQRSEDEKFAGLQVLVQQALSAATSADKAVAVIQNNIQQSMRDQEGKLLPPVVQLSTRMDSMSNDFRTLQQAVSDVTNMIGKLQTQLTDLNNAMKVLSAPPAAPPPPAAGAAALGPPPLSATDMYANADRDRSAGNTDLALQGFSNYLKYYGDTAQAPDAQFYIGYIHFLQGDYETAATDFDAVVERYPSANVRVPQSLYYKGSSLLKLSRKTEASQAFRDVLKQYPNSANAKPACDQLIGLGINCGVPKAPAKAAKPPARKK